MLGTIDRGLLALCNRGVACRPLDWLMPRLTNLHHQRVFMALVIVALVALAVRGDRRIRLWIACAVLAVVVSDAAAYRVVKALVHRDRPCRQVVVGGPMSEPDDRLVPGEHCPGSPSFPSNHASNTAALAAVCIGFARSRKRWLWLLLPLVIGFSRLYLGVHYPSDVLGGWVLGALIGTVLVWAYRTWLGLDREAGVAPG